MPGHRPVLAPAWQKERHRKPQRREVPEAHDFSFRFDYTIIIKLSVLSIKAELSKQKRPESRGRLPWPPSGNGLFVFKGQEALPGSETRVQTFGPHEALGKGQRLQG
jgi:hypothetical protein